MYKNQLILRLIKKYNEEFHVGTDLSIEDLHTLDESEMEDFLNWITKDL